MIGVLVAASIEAVGDAADPILDEIDIEINEQCEESCIRKAVGERGLIPGPVGLADTTAEDGAATGTSFGLTSIESMGKGRQPGGLPARRGVKEETVAAIMRRHAGG
jgi:hypothetical protein